MVLVVLAMRGSENQVPFLGVLIVRIMVCWGLFWGPLFVETPISEASTEGLLVSARPLQWSLLDGRGVSVRVFGASSWAVRGAGWDFS